MTAFAGLLREDAFTDRATDLALSVASAGGFWPTEPPAAPRPLGDDTAVHACAPLLTGHGRIAACGHVVSGTVPALVERLAAGETVRVHGLPASERRLLEELEGIRAVTRVDLH